MGLSDATINELGRDEFLTLLVTQLRNQDPLNPVKDAGPYVPSPQSVVSDMLRYAEVREHSWAAPGHQGGVAFLKSNVGRVFFDLFGENTFRMDMGIERGSLGSLLDHTGPIGAGERLAARVFGAERTYSVTNGTSGSNRIVMSACLGEGRIALCDRNCHKSIEQGLMLTGARPSIFFSRSKTGRRNFS